MDTQTRKIDISCAISIAVERLRNGIFSIDLTDYSLLPPCLVFVQNTQVSYAAQLNTTLLLGLRSTRNNFV